MKTAKAAARRGDSPAFESLSIAQLVHRFPSTLEVLERHGVHFCAGCFITLDSQPRKAAGYHAVEDLAAFLKDLSEAVAVDEKRKEP